MASWSAGSRCQARTAGRVLLDAQPRRGAEARVRQLKLAQGPRLHRRGADARREQHVVRAAAPPQRAWRLRLEPCKERRLVAAALRRGGRVLRAPAAEVLVVERHHVHVPGWNEQHVGARRVAREAGVSERALQEDIA